MTTSTPGRDDAPTAALSRRALLRPALLAPLVPLVAAGRAAAADAPAAAAPGSPHLEALTWTELRERIGVGATTVLVPCGGTEQNGPHMVLGKHNVRVRALAGRIAGALGNALVAPVVAYVPEGSIDPPVAHMRFPGTLTVPEAVFEALLESAARSLRHHGFRDVVLLGDHGGYQKALERVAARLDRAWRGEPGAARVHALGEYYRASQAGFGELLAARGFAASEIGTHAGLADTSLTLAIDPALVRRERLVQAATGGLRDGVGGDPRRASAELGELGLARIVERSVEAIRQRTARR